jgi:hypothetical protein
MVLAMTVIVPTLYMPAPTPAPEFFEIVLSMTVVVLS